MPVSSSNTPAPVRPYAWLTSLIVLITLLAFLIGGIALYFVEERMVGSAGESLSLAAAGMAGKVDWLLYERYGDIQMMARAFGNQKLDPQYVTDYLIRMRQSYPVYLWLGVTDRHGRIIAATDPRTVGQEEGHSTWFQTVRDEGTTHVGDMEPYAAVGGTDAIAFTAPINGPKGEFVGAVTSRVGLAALEAVVVRTIRGLEEQDIFPGAIEYQFLTQSGVAFIDSDLRHKGNVNLKELGLPSAALAESGHTGFVEEKNLRRHVWVVTGYASTKGFLDFRGLRWTVLVRMDRSHILAPIRDFLWKLGGAAVLIWAPAFLLLLWSTRHIKSQWEQLQIRERQYSELVQDAPDAIVSLDLLGHFQYFNPAAERYSGYRAEEVLGKHFAKVGILTPDSQVKAMQEFELVVAGEERPIFEMEVVTREGVRLVGEAYPTVLRDGDRIAGVLVTIRDITQRRRAELRLHAQHVATRVLSEKSTVEKAAPEVLRAICETLDWDAGLLWRVDRQATLLRFEASWSVRQPPVLEFANNSTQMTFAQGIGLPGRVWDSGKPLWIPNVLEDRNFPRAVMAAKAGLHGAFGFPIRLAEETLGVMEFFSHEIRPPDEDLLNMMTALGTQFAQLIERERLEGQFHQSQKMEAIGQLAGGIAHDFNNLLTVILGYCNLLLGVLPTQDPSRSNIEEIQIAGQRATALTKQLLLFSRKQALEFKVVDLNEIVGNVERMLRRLIGEDIKLQTVLDPELGRVKGDPSQLEQVILNLAVNARDAMPQGGRLIIETANVDLDETYARRHFQIPPGSYVMLALSDTGKGMDPETLQHCFEPFFTTKPVGQGTGLGLATVYGIVKQSEGGVWVYSESGMGTTFKIFLPKVEGDLPDEEFRRVPETAPTGKETVLVVEDDAMIRSVVAKNLRVKGYTVLEAMDDQDALRMGRDHRGTIHLLLTDVVMPGMSGREVAAMLKKTRPDLRVLYMSGYTNEAIVRHGGIEPDVDFLQKPFRMDALASKIREILDRPSPT